MKKFICAMVAGLIACTSFAATQYTYDFGKITPFFNNTGKSGVLAYSNRWVQDSSNLQNTLQIVQSSSVFISFTGEAPAAFGAFIVDGTAKGQELSLVSMGDGYYTIADAFNQPYTFEPGATIGFWIEGTDGKKIYNIPRMDGEHFATYNGTFTLDEYTTLINAFGENMSVGTINSNTEGWDKSTYFMNINVGTATPASSGQPLPGVLAALVLGGGALAARKRKK